MVSEWNEGETARSLALRSLKNELELAIRLLREVKDAREVTAMEPEVIRSAREAFRHAVEALNRMPQLAEQEMQSVQALIDRFRTALADLDH